MSTILSTVFPGADANPIGSPWTTITGAQPIKQVSHVAKCSTTGSCAVADNVNSYPADQWSRVFLGLNSGTGAFFSARVRVSTGTPSWVTWQGKEGTTGASLLWRTNATTSGTFQTQLLTTLPVGGDIYYLGVQGNTYTMIQNGVTIATYTDGTAKVTSGHAGFGLNAPTTVNDVWFNEVQTGDFDTLLAGGIT